MLRDIIQCLGKIVKINLTLTIIVRHSSTVVSIATPTDVFYKKTTVGISCVISKFE